MIPLTMKIYQHGAATLPRDDPTWLCVVFSMVNIYLQTDTPFLGHCMKQKNIGLATIFNYDISVSKTANKV